MSYPFPTISSNIDSLNTCSYYTEKDLSIFNVSQSIDIFFGKSSNDIIEFSIFDIYGNAINWKVLNKQDTYNVLTETYKDVDERRITYNYKKYNGSYTISKDRQILLNTLQDLSDANIKNGNQVVSYNFLRNVSGNSDYNLVIKSISPDRKEIQLVPSFNLDINDDENLLQNINYEAFARKMILVNDLVDIIIDKTNTYNITNYYFTFAKNNPTIISFVKSTFGLKTDADIIEYLQELYQGYSSNFKLSDTTNVSDNYTGIKNYIIKWLYTYNKTLINISDLKAQFKYIIDVGIKKELSKLNYNYNSLDQNNYVQTFIDNLFYYNFISPMLDDIGNSYYNKFYTYLKNCLNFGNNKVFPIINHSFVADGDNTILVVKLFDYLTEDVGLRDTCWVSNISLVPIIQKVVITHVVSPKHYKISGPNFKINLKGKNTQISKNQNYKSENQLKLSDVQNQIDFNKKLQILNVDYTNFKNFILFSSAQLRVKLFKNKLNQLNSYSASLATINEKISNLSNYSTSVITSSIISSYSYDTNAINTQVTNIYESFDGYESYLYKSELLTDDLYYQNYLSGAIEYDFNNRDSLVNNTPEYINSNDDNSDYLIFLSMVGHFFDNIYLYIQNFPTNQYVSNSSDNSFINNTANIMLEQFGWTPISSVDQVLLDQYYINDPETSGSLSGAERMKIIWSRILNNLPIIYKTKGTEESIKLLSNIYGIPNNLVKIKEFGGNNLSDEDESSYIFQQRYYFTKYSGSAEYVEIPCSQDVKSIEFKFKINTNHNYKFKDSVNLLVKNENFKVDLYKEKETSMGIITFTLGNQVFYSDSLPLFNGKIFNVLITRNEVVNQTLIDSGSPPSFYKFIVNNVDDDNIIFESNEEKLLDYSYSSIFTTGNFIYFGNTISGSNNFYGNLDKINIWNIELNPESFVNHSKNFDAYDDGNYDSTYANLYFRYSYEYPENLNTSNGQPIPIKNSNNFYKGASNYYGYAYNFKYTNEELISCSYVYSSIYPYQFSIIDINQNIKYKDIGPNKFKNSKINKVTQRVLARLMPNESSTSQIQVNNNSNLVAVYISPYSIQDEDIMNFTGECDLMDAIGDPANLYKSRYDSLETLRNDYNTNNLAEKVLYQEFMTLYKNYIDSSFFDSVKKLIPARSKLFTGVLIESNIIERNKYQNRPIDAYDSHILDITPSNKLNDMSVAFEKTNSSSLSVDTPKYAYRYHDWRPAKYISNDAMDTRLSAFSINGLYNSYKNNEFVNDLIYKNVDTVYSPNHIPDSSDIIYVTSSVVSYNFVNSSSFSKIRNNITPNILPRFDNNCLDKTNYPKGHYSICRNGNNTRFTTNSNNTVDQESNYDGSSPITLTSVNVGGSVTKLVTI